LALLFKLIDLAIGGHNAVLNFGTARGVGYAQVDRTPTHGHEPTREAAMAAFAKGWGRK
jgi:hypothetical protein